jgi:DNA-binding NarL/FixJ family response regulator
MKIVIFDDNKNIRASIELLLNTEQDFELVGSFGDADSCVKKVLQLMPDIVLMDIEMPGINGIEAVKLLKREAPQVHILIQTIFEDDDRIYASILAGASGYLLKSHINSSLLTSIRDLQSGGSPMSPSIARRVLHMLQEKRIGKGIYTTDYHLTAREKEVLSSLVNGLSYKAIAGELNISYETVRSHMKNIYEKLHVASLTEVVAKAINQSIV